MTLANTLLGTPRDVLAAATDQANVLMEVVEARQLYQTIRTKKYLEAEAWEIILAFNRAHPIPEWVRPITEAGQITGYVARVNIVQDGIVVSAGEMPCGFDDFPCQGKEGTAKHKAAMSAAQTWALSKAAKMKFAWVAVLGGFAPTPAEEMQGESPGDAEPSPESSPYYCHEHKTPRFKRGSMRNYAHPIGETGKWCNMPKEQHSVGSETSQAAPIVPASSPPTFDLEVERQTISDGFAALGLATVAEQLKWRQEHTPMVPDSTKTWKPLHYHDVVDALTQAIRERNEAHASQ